MTMTFKEIKERVDSICEAWYADTDHRTQVLRGDWPTLKRFMIRLAIDAKLAGYEEAADHLEGIAAHGDEQTSRIEILAAIRAAATQVRKLAKRHEDKS